MGQLLSCDPCGETKKPTARQRFSTTVESVTLQRRINLAILRLKASEPTDPAHKLTLSKVLLKFDKLRAVLKTMKYVYDEVARDKKKGLNIDELEAAMFLLHGKISKEEVMVLFNFIDVDASKQVEFEEFLVALTVGFVLDLIPAFSEEEHPENLLPVEPTPAVVDNPLSPLDTETNFETEKMDEIGPAEEVKPSRLHLDTSDEEVIMKRSPSSFMGRSPEVKTMLHLIVRAYLLFEPDNEGFIKYESVERVMEEDGHKLGSVSVSAQRFKEMDWDESGLVDFAEFASSFFHWMDVEEDVGSPIKF